MSCNSGSGRLARRRAPFFLYLSTTNAFTGLSNSNFIAASGAKEGQGLRHEIGIVLENPAMPGVLVDNQLRPGDAAGHIGAVDGRDHDIIVAIGDQDRDIDPAEILRRLPTPGFDRLELP